MLTSQPTRPASTPPHPVDGETEGTRTVALRFNDNILLQRLLGDHDRHLVRLEQGFGVRLSCRGNKIAITGEKAAVGRAQAAIIALYNQLEHGGAIDSSQVDGVIRLTALPSRNDRGGPDRGRAAPANGAAHADATHADASGRPVPRPAAPNGHAPAPAHQQAPHQPAHHQPAHHQAALALGDLPSLRTKRGVIAPRSPGQADYMRMLGRADLTFGIGPAGTGKTYLAVAQGVAMLLAGKVDRIVLSRPAVEAGERLGFLPGDMREKIDPYLRPLYDALNDMMPNDQVVRRMGTGEIEVAPLAFMRGRTLAHSYVILDEAQNTTPAQMKMFLTRMGEGTRMAVTGDLTQIDLPRGVSSGLEDAVRTLDGVKGVGVMRLSSGDVVRHPLVGRIIDAYEQREPHDEAPEYRTAPTRAHFRGRGGRESNGTSKSSRQY